ncbi:MAG TPA: LysM peptidoglycan-binding domain-containing protein [Cellvibrio sp.]|nr:LysM peptidoglycan-binding domain-containing protein [Cellvibrio sp.]
MKKIMIGFVAATLFSMAAMAEDARLRVGHPDEYTVKKGDTLWDISSTFLSKPWKWPEIWHANPQIENPHLIYPGDLIRLIYVDGQPRLVSERTVKFSGGDQKLSPSIRVQQNSEAIATIPLDRINSFLSQSKVVDRKELETAPYLLAGPQKRIVMGAGDLAYARGKFNTDLTNYGVYRKAEAFIDPDTKELLGVQATGVGSVSIKALDGDVATVDVTRANEEIRIGDRLLPGEDRPMQSIFYPSAPDNDIKGTIIAVESGVTMVGKFNVVMVNKGERDQLKEGNVLAIYKKGETVVDRVSGGKVVLPDERAGLLIIFRTFTKMSYGLVLEADRQLAVGDKALNP